LARSDGPGIDQLLELVDPSGVRRWLNVDGSFIWRQPHPAEEGPYEYGRRELGVWFTGYFVDAEDTEEFMEWAKTVDFYGRWMPEPHESGSLYLGEYGWSPAFRHSFSDCLDGGDWVRPIWTPPHGQDGVECPGVVRPASFTFLSGSNGFDCFTKESYALRLPHLGFIKYAGLQWSGDAADYYDNNGELAAFDPTAYEDGPSGLLLRRDLLDRYLAENGLALCWVILGEKMILGGSMTEGYQGRLKISGAYRYTTDSPVGFLNYDVDIPGDESTSRMNV
jgi:hypothetical protein